MDRFGESARKGLDFLKSRARETVEVTRLNSAIRELEERRDQCLLDLGHRVMLLVDGPEFDKEALRDRVEEVKAINAELEAARAEVEQLKAALKSSVEEIIPGGSGRGETHHPDPRGSAWQPSSPPPPSVPTPPSYE
jgi:hypothetical protein